MNNPIRRARPERTGIRAPLGDLELSVMRHVWDCGADGCQGTDVQQALDRLRDKGIVRREREGKAYRYWPLLSEEQLQERIVTGVMDRLIAQFPKAVAAYFVQQGLAGQEADAAGLSDLARRVETIRSVQQGEEPHQAQDESEAENNDGR